MFKTLSFYVCGILMIGVLLVNLWFSTAAANLSQQSEVFERYVSSGGMYVICFVSVFIALFIGTDYTYGTIRNKITAGHGRCSVYLSNLVVSSVGGVIYCAVYWAVMAAVCLGAGWRPEMSFGELMYQVFICVGVVVSACSMLSVVGMIITSKASAVTLTVVIMVGMFLITSLLIELLHAGNGDYMRINGPLRGVLINFCSLLPFGQALQIAIYEPVRDIAAFPLYSAAFIALMTGLGLIMFRVKDLK